MFRYIMQQWKKRILIVLLIIIGFFIGSLVMSLGISASVESFEYIHDQKMGNPEEQVNISLTNFTNNWNQKDVENFIEKLSEYGEIQLLSMENGNLTEYNVSFPIVPVLFNEEPNWHVPLLEGNYFSKEDMNKSSVIIGKSIAEEYEITLGDQIQIEDKSFDVIGIVGRQTRETSWQHAIYMPWKKYIGLFENSFLDNYELNNISIHLERGKSQFIKHYDILKKELNEKGMDIYYEGTDEVEDSELRNSIVLTIIATILIFTIAVINIVHLMQYWLIERQREFGIMKALGANSSYIAKIVLFEILTISIFGSILAILVQYIAMLFLSDSAIGKEISLKVTWLNLLFAIGISLFFGVLSAIIPMIKIKKLDPIRIINRT